LLRIGKPCVVRTTRRRFGCPGEAGGGGGVCRPNQGSKCYSMGSGISLEKKKKESCNVTANSGAEEGTKAKEKFPSSVKLERHKTGQTGGAKKKTTQMFLGETGGAG